MIWVARPQIPFFGGSVVPFFLDAFFSPFDLNYPFWIIFWLALDGFSLTFPEIVALAGAGKVNTIAKALCFRPPLFDLFDNPTPGFLTVSVTPWLLLNFFLTG